MYSLYSDIMHPISLMRINCTICLKYFVTGTNNFIYYSVPEKILFFVKAKTGYKSCFSKAAYGTTD